jgi:hypothetical protein
LRIDAIQFADFDERGDTGLARRALVMAGEQCILRLSTIGHAALDDVGIELDAAVIEEAGGPPE